MSSNGGKTPCWRESFEFDAKSHDENITFRVFDSKMLGSNELLGEVTIKVLKLAEKDSREKLKLRCQGVDSGEL